MLFSCHHHFTKHPRVHVQHQVAVPCPSPQGISRNEEADALSRLHRNCVASCQKLSVRRFQLTPHAVQMHGVRHHGVVVQYDPDPLAVLKAHRRRFPILSTVERPAIALPIFPVRWSSISRSAPRGSIGPPTVCKSASVSTRRPLLRRPMPGSS